MNAVQRIVKNIGAYGVSQIIINFLAFILLIYIARFFGEAEFGVYSFALSFTTLFIVFADIGISQLMIREIARDKKRTGEYFVNASLIKIILAVFTFGLIVSVSHLMNYPQDVRYIIYLFGIYNILTSFAQMLMSIFQAFEKLEYVAATTIIEKIIVISLGIYVLFSGYGLNELAYVYVLASIINLIISFSLVVTRFIKPLPQPIPKINISLWKPLTIGAIPFGLNTLFGMLFFKIDTVLLYILKDDVAVGIYNAAYNPLLALGTVITGMSVNAIYPVMSRNFVNSNDSLKNFTMISSKYMFILGVPISVGCLILANRFIELFYGNQYSAAVIAFQILSLFMPLRLVSSLTGTHLTSSNKQGIRTFIVFISAVFNVFLNIILIPSYSYIGASIATVISEIVLYYGLLISLNKYNCNLIIDKLALKPAIASVIMGIFLFLFQKNNLILIITLGTIIYTLMLFILKTFDETDRYILKSIFKKNKKMIK